MPPSHQRALRRLFFLSGAHPRQLTQVYVWRLWAGLRVPMCAGDGVGICKVHLQRGGGSGPRGARRARPERHHRPTAAPRLGSQHSLGAVHCEGSSTTSRENGFSGHGGQRGRPLGGAAASTFGVGGVGGDLFGRIGVSAPVVTTASWVRARALLAERGGCGAPGRRAVTAQGRRRLAACCVGS